MAKTARKRESTETANLRKQLAARDQELMLLKGGSVTAPSAAPAPATPKRSIGLITTVDLLGDRGEGQDQAGGPRSLRKSMLDKLNGEPDSIERLAFESDPNENTSYHSLYKHKSRLLPDTILKRIAIQDDLVACIVQARCNQLARFGRPREDRFQIGFVVEPTKRALQELTIDQRHELQKQIDRAIKLLSTCGHEQGWDKEDRLSLSQWLYLSARNAIVVGRIATEIVQVPNDAGELEFHSFRPIDAGTIYKAAPQNDAAARALRETSRHLLEQLRGERLDPDRFVADEYVWVQVLDGRPVQAFTGDECIVRNFYQVLDYELDGYPVTPLDTVISAVTTHLNITTHNKLYFQTGRAARGMLVFQSDDIDEDVVQRIRQQFNASINSVNNAWRMPVFAVGSEDKVTWQAIDSGSRDMEFQYLSDQNARALLSAFQMSPEELPGWAYLSRGTNNQALSESNNEYRLEAHRDLGIRPLIEAFEDFLNKEILPLIDPELAKKCVVKLLGLDAETAEKESVRLQQDMPTHMTYNEALDKVEKSPVPAMVGGDFPLNPSFGANLDKFNTVGEIKETFFGHRDQRCQDGHIQGCGCGSKNVADSYRRDPFYWQQRQELMQKFQMAQQFPMLGQLVLPSLICAIFPEVTMDQARQLAPQMIQMAQQMQQQQAQAQAQQQDGGGDNGGGGEGGGGAQQDDGGGQPGGPGDGQNAPQEQGDLTRSIDQALGLLSKSESQLPAPARRLLGRQKKLVSSVVKGLEKDLDSAIQDIIGQARELRESN